MSKKNRSQSRELKNRKKIAKNRERYKEHKESLLSQILKFDNPVLKTPCSLVSKDEDLDFITIVKKVLCVTKNGVGLSANQIGISKQVFVLRFDTKVNNLLVMINPEIIEHTDPQILKHKNDIYRFEEGCLSYPGIFCKVNRYYNINIRYYDEKFEVHEEEFSGFRSFVVQHEIDHVIFGNCYVGQEWERQQKTILGIIKPTLIDPIYNMSIDTTTVKPEVIEPVDNIETTTIEPEVIKQETIEPEIIK